MSTDIAEGLPAKRKAPAPVVAKAPKGKGKSAPPAKGGGKEKVHLKKLQRREFVRQYMIFVIVQEEKI